MEFDSSSHSFLEEAAFDVKSRNEDFVCSNTARKGSIKKRGRGPTEDWMPALLSSQFFGACPCHKDFKKNECTYFCTTCAKPGEGLCQHCVPDHTGHDLLQIRRYVYCDVVRTADVVPSVDITGVQTYIINQAKVIFLNHRPQSRFAKVGSSDTCKTCHRSLREGCSFCSLACRVADLMRSGKKLKPSPASSEEAEFDQLPAHLISSSNIPRRRRTSADSVARVLLEAEPCDETGNSSLDSSGSGHIAAGIVRAPARRGWVVRNRRKQASPRRSPVA